MQFSSDMKDCVLQVCSGDKTLSFLCEKKECSTEVVLTGIVRKTLARMVKFINMVLIMELQWSTPSTVP